MSRTVAALYDSRAEAELARNRLVSGVRAKSPRIIAKDTLGAVDGLSIDPKTKAKYREAVRDGSNLLVAELPPRAAAKQVVELLNVFVSDSKAEWPPAQLPNAPVADGEQAFQVVDEAPEEPAPPPTPAAVMPPVAPAEPMRTPAAPPRAPAEPMRAAAAASDVPAPVPPPAAAAEEPKGNALDEDVSTPRSEEELRVGKPEVARVGARVHSFTRESPAEEQVSLRVETVDVERRPSQRRLSDEEVAAGGLFKDRVVDIAEMREVPIVTKTAVVREEVIIRKRIVERTETVRDTVRRTQIEVEDLPAGGNEGSPPRFFARGKGGS